MLLWGAASKLQHSVLFPSPFAIITAEYHLIVSGELLRDSAVSLTRIAIGFVLGCGLGIPLGLAMGLFPVVRVFLDPLVQFLRFVP
ncbi:MAG: ABC transporter permease, partial [Vulcanimicrobiaceae bacterium]